MQRNRNMIQTNMHPGKSGGIRILCTLGPSSLNRQVIERLTDRGVDYFRINMSHTSLESLEEVIHTIRQYSETPICIDTEGAQVRTGQLKPSSFELKDRQRIKLCSRREVEDETELSLWPECVFEQLKPGHLLAVDFDSALLMVREVSHGEADAVVINGGMVGSNKAVTVNPAPRLPALSQKDIETVEIALRHCIENFALSFANAAEDVAWLRSLVGPRANITSKIESHAGVRNLDGILHQSDAILIDRGDLSREVAFENIPLLQKCIIRKANAANKPVYIATNLLESMMANRKPTRAELNDVMNTLLDGANGLVLAAETAVGDHPVAAVDMLTTLVQRYQKSLEGYRISDLLEITSPLLPKPHGHAHLETSSFSSRYNFSQIVDNLPVLEIGLEAALDVEQLSNGVFSPLDGFMDQPTLENVLNDYRLPTGEIWTMPIVLQMQPEQVKKVYPGMSVRLKLASSDKVIAVMHVQDKFRVDLESVSQRWFGTTERKHPGVQRLLDRGDTLLGGPIEQVEPLENEWSHYNLTPEKTRMIFGMKGWSKIVAFHTRNVPHRGHEFVIQEALKRANADGVFVHPVIGPKKSGDFVPEVILGVYDMYIEESLPGALLGAFMTYPRYCGPREAVFTALCRKNFGCTHFIIGRDHAGVGDYYSQTSARELIDSLGDIGIELIYFDRVSYCKSKDTYVEGQDGQGELEAISGTFVRESLRNGTPIPDWCMRESSSQWLQKRFDAGEPVFVE